MADIPLNSLLGLPAEIIDQIASYLPPFDLARTSQTCRLLHTHCMKDDQWRSFVQNELPRPLDSASPFSSFRDLYIAHHSYFFLTRHKIWFSDSTYHGRLLVSRFDPRRGCIEAYTLVAEQGEIKHGTLTWDPPVLYQTFHPRVRLDLNLPVIHLGTHEAEVRRRENFKFQPEINMRPSGEEGNNISSTFMFARNQPGERIGPGVLLWPPLKLPSPLNQRALIESRDSFRSNGHRPTSVHDASDAIFRIRQWIEFRHWFPFGRGGGSSNRVGEMVTTYGTIPSEAYTPTKEKPWQGIWCGDYSAHGCEFLLITQPDSPAPLPEKARRAIAAWPQHRSNLFNAVDGLVEDSDESGDDEDGTGAGFTADDTAYFNHGVLPTSLRAVTRYLRGRTPSQGAASSAAAPAPPTWDPDDVAPYRGRLEAIKLTGDPNVPRGEYTFIVNDLGAKGFIGYAHDEVFNPGRSAGEAESSTAADDAQSEGTGARMVKCVGHVAADAYSNDRYIPSQLILISEDKLAMYWRPFEHVSFYERVDLDKLLDWG